MQTLDEWNGQLSSLKEVLPDVRLVAAKRLTLKEMRNNQVSAPNAIVLGNLRRVLFRLKETDHENYINHVVALLTDAGECINTFDDFLSLLDMLPLSSYQRWIANNRHVWTQDFFSPNYLRKIDFFKALTHKPLAILRLISHFKFESVLAHINNPEEQLYRIANLSWNDLPEIWQGHSEPHHYLIQLRTFIYLTFSKFNSGLLQECNEEWSTEEWSHFLVAFTQRTEEICKIHHIDPSLPLLFIANSSLLTSTYQRLTESYSDKDMMDEQARETNDFSLSRYSFISENTDRHRTAFDYSDVSIEGLEHVLPEIVGCVQQLDFIKQLPPELLEAQIPHDNPERLKTIIDYFKPFHASSPHLERWVLERLQAQWMQPKLHEMMFKTAMASLNLKNADSFLYYQRIVLTLIESIKDEQDPVIQSLLNLSANHYIVQKNVHLIGILIEKMTHSNRSKAIQYSPDILDVILAIKAFTRSAKANKNMPTVNMWHALNIKITSGLNKFGNRGHALATKITAKIKTHTDQLTPLPIQLLSNDAMTNDVFDESLFFVDFEMATENCHSGNITALKNAILTIRECSQSPSEIYRSNIMQENLGNALVSVAKRTDATSPELLEHFLYYITPLYPHLIEKNILHNGFAKALCLAAHHAFFDQYQYLEKLNKKDIPYFIFITLLQWIKTYNTDNTILLKAVSLFVRDISFDLWDKIIDCWPETEKKTIIALFWHALSDNPEDQTAFLRHCMMKRDLAFIDIRMGIHQQLAYLNETTPINNPGQLRRIIQHFKDQERLNTPPNPHFIVTLLEALKSQWAFTRIHEENKETVVIALNSLDTSQPMQKEYRDDFLKQYGVFLFDHSNSEQNEPVKEVLQFVAFCHSNLNISYEEMLTQFIPLEHLLFVTKTLFLDLDSKQDTLATDIEPMAYIHILLNALRGNQTHQDLFLDYCIQKKGLHIILPFVPLSQRLAFIQKFAHAGVSDSPRVSSSTMHLDEKKTDQDDVITLFETCLKSITPSFIQKNPHLVKTPEKLTMIFRHFQNDSSELTLLNNIKTQWIEPLNGPMFKAVRSILDLEKPSHLTYFEDMYSILSLSCSKEENVIDISEPIEMYSMLRLIKKNMTFKRYLDEKKQNKQIPLPELIDTLVAIQLFNQRHPNNTTENCAELKKVIATSLHLYTPTASGEQKISGSRRKDVVTWFQKKVDTTVPEEPPVSIKSVLSQTLLPPPTTTRKIFADSTTENQGLGDNLLISMQK